MTNERRSEWRGHTISFCRKTITLKSQIKITLVVLRRNFSEEIEFSPNPIMANSSPPEETFVHYHVKTFLIQYICSDATCKNLVLLPRQRHHESQTTYLRTGKSTASRRQQKTARASVGAFKVKRSEKIRNLHEKCQRSLDTCHVSTRQTHQYSVIVKLMCTWAYSMTNKSQQSHLPRLQEARSASQWRRRPDPFYTRD